jgi:vitamin B12 transporter
MTNDAGLVQLQSNLSERVLQTVSLRHDSNDRFGGRTTYRYAPALLVPELGTKFKGSMGTGSKAPSLNQLFVSYPAFNFFANPTLSPEESLGFDLGFEQSVFKERVQLGATYFQNHIDNLITSNVTGTSWQNIAKATTSGVESFIIYKPLDRLTLRSDHTYTIAEDAVSHLELLRRPVHKASFNASWQVTEAASLSATAIHVGPWIDGNRDFSIPRLNANGYTLVNLTSAYKLSVGVSAFARIDNLLDQRYQDPMGFQRPGLGVFAGLRVAFNAADLRL